MTDALTRRLKGNIDIKPKVVDKRMIKTNSNFKIC